MRLFTALLDLLYPPKCAFCHKLLRSEKDGVCKACREHLPYTGVLAARTDLKQIDKCVAPLFYEKTVRDSLHRYKFSHCPGYAGIYAEFMVKSIDENQISCDIISWVPVSRRRLRSRGYDQARLLAEAVAKTCGAVCLPTLEKQRHTKQQSLIRDPKARRDNVRGAYRCADPALVAGKRILLIDDIVTTGATLSECAGVLRQAGAASVSAAAAARKRD